MKIAVPSTDGVNISEHFGRSACFVVFETENSRILSKEIRDNTFTAQARGECHHEGRGHGSRSHAALAEALADCSVVVCYGMGRRAAEELKQNGIKTYLVRQSCTVEAAVRLYLDGKLLPAGEGLCGCH